MRKSICAITIVILLLGNKLLLGESLPTYVVKHAIGAITIDGLMNEPDWAIAESLHFSFAESEAKKGNTQSALAKMLWDDKNFYAFFRCNDENILATHTERDSNVSGDDCVEIFISPDSDKARTYFNFEINVCGVLLDQARVVDRKPWIVLEQWNADIKVKQVINGTLNDDSDVDRYWTMEIAIPFQNFSRVSCGPKSGQRWRLNLNRVNRLGKRDEYQYSQWALGNPEKQESFHTPEMFGSLIFK